MAAAWAAAKANGRPRYSAVASVNRWLSEHPPPGVDNLQAALHALQSAYHDAGGLPPDQAAWLASQQPQLPPAIYQRPDGTELPPGGPQAAPAGVSAGQSPPEHPYQVIMVMLARLENEILAVQARVDLIIAAAEFDTSQLPATPQVSDVQRRIQGIAEQYGWTPGPATPGPDQAHPGPAMSVAPPPDFYAGHVVAPDFQAMAQAAEDAPDQGEDE